MLSEMLPNYRSPLSCSIYLNTWSEQELLSTELKPLQRLSQKFSQRSFDQSILQPCPVLSDSFALCTRWLNYMCFGLIYTHRGNTRWHVTYLWSHFFLHWILKRKNLIWGTTQGQHLILVQKTPSNLHSTGSVLL